MMSARLTAERLAKARARISSPADVWLAARMCAWALTLRALKHFVSLPSLVALVRRRPAAPARDVAAEQKVITIARWVCRYTQPREHGTCLEQALLTYRYLTALNASPRLIVGVAPAASAGKDIRGHAWVAVDGVPVDDTDETLQGMAEIVSFDSDGRRIAP